MKVIHEYAPVGLGEDPRADLDLSVGFELINDIISTNHALDAELAAFGYQTTEQLIDDEETQTLQEKYDLAFDPEVAVRGVGGTALAMVMANPETAQHFLTDEALETLADQPKSDEKSATSDKEKEKTKKHKQDDRHLSTPQQSRQYESSVAMTADEVGDAAKELIYVTTGMPVDEE